MKTISKLFALAALLAPALAQAQIQSQNPATAGGNGKAARDCVAAGTATASEPGPNAVISNLGTCPKGMVPQNPTHAGAGSSVNGVASGEGEVGTSGTAKAGAGNQPTAPQHK